jgi:hypothetical protein
MDALLMEHNGWQLIRFDASGIYFIVKYGPGERQHKNTSFAYMVEYAMEVFERNVLVDYFVQMRENFQLAQGGNA